MSMNRVQPPSAALVLVLNYRFTPADVEAPYIYGAVQHAIQIARLLETSGLKPYFLLYRRTDELSEPQIAKDTFLGWDAVTVSFNFEMPAGLVQQAIQNALSTVLGLEAMTPLYCQSLVIADFLPERAPIVVTNHSPFVESVFRALTPAIGRQAFDWDHPKADFLLERQTEVLRSLLGRSHVVFAEISRIQIRFLRQYGFGEDRLYLMPPPVGGGAPPSPELLPCMMRELYEAQPGRYALLPVSRFDGFKDLEFFVAGASTAIQAGELAGAIMIGGAIGDRSVARALSGLATTTRNRFLHLPRQRHDVLIRAIFPWISGHGVVACTSRYDLVPYTMLEAILARAQVVVPDSTFVGVAEYLPDRWRFARNPQSLAKALAIEIRSDELCLVRRKIAKMTSADAVLSSLRKAIEAARG